MLRAAASPEGDVILCTSYLELERGTKEELETKQKRDTSMMMKKEERENEWFLQTARMQGGFHI